MNGDFITQLLNRTDWPQHTAIELAKIRLQQLSEEKRKRITGDALTLLDFVQKTYVRYHADQFHVQVASDLEEVVRGRINRMMIFAPPQHGKSELVSVRLPPYWFGNRPDDPIILASYGSTLAVRNSRLARNIIESPEYRLFFPNIQTDPQSRSSLQWNLAGFRGQCLAVGVGGPVTGHGAMLGIIDDPHKDWAEAQSKTIRDSVWDWWKGTFYTRIWEGGAILIIMTRWHEDDLAGRLMASEGEKWTVRRYPALAEDVKARQIFAKKNPRIVQDLEHDIVGREPGLPLAPTRFSRETLESVRDTVGSMVWSAEYQGSPTAPEGNRFKRSWFEIKDAAPAVGRRIRYWDKAGTDGSGARSAGLLLLKPDDDPFWYVENVVYGQWSAFERNKIIKQTARFDAGRTGNSVTIWLEQEGGSGGKESGEISISDLAGFPVFVETATGSKDVRLEPVRAQCEAGNVKLIEGEWNWEFLEEVCSIPNGRFRDMADALSGAFNKMSEDNVLEGDMDSDLGDYRG